MKGAVELLDIRPEQLTSNDFGQRQVGLQFIKQDSELRVMRISLRYQS